MCLFQSLNNQMELYFVNHFVHTINNYCEGFDMDVDDSIYAFYNNCYYLLELFSSNFAANDQLLQLWITLFPFIMNYMPKYNDALKLIEKK